jgi:hypothetical protein
MKMSVRIAASLVAAGATVALVGCSYTTQRAPGMHLQGLSLDNLCRQDYEVSDAVEGQATLKRIFFLPVPLMDRRYASAGTLLTPRNAIAAAFYDAQQKNPTADAFLPTTTSVSTTAWPLIPKAIYSVEDATVRGKAVRLKTGDGSHCK